ncbi:uncharacterized protein MYCFIDRAFT_180367 [Pseudocercospora fijiensis CIRAD86]|uniref:Uncharacterized protein n=1 Tax=Pseudocercospora fijiensis (strain CIRAD86) TaxID=383855 RepID=M2YGU3_PSEFD|nr:uncharacterized protein MYCFIDRAFT_180367 [Pseudocercospora fijiensis CIRAD86]EME77035.1 hypothetical protein MYCFIDRAFT_180367 [Pseudocercospora fijiensis CIRAD86]
MLSMRASAPVQPCYTHKLVESLSLSLATVFEGMRSGIIGLTALRSLMRRESHKAWRQVTTHEKHTGRYHHTAGHCLLPVPPFSPLSTPHEHYSEKVMEAGGQEADGQKADGQEAMAASRRSIDKDSWRPRAALRSAEERAINGINNNNNNNSGLNYARLFHQVNLHILIQSIKHQRKESPESEDVELDETGRLYVHTEESIVDDNDEVENVTPAFHLHLYPPSPSSTFTFIHLHLHPPSPSSTFTFIHLHLHPPTHLPKNDTPSGKMFQRLRRDTNAFDQDAAGLHRLALPPAECLTIDHLDSWLATLSTALEAPSSLWRSTISDFTEWMKMSSPTAGGLNIIVIHDEAAEGIPVACVHCSSGPVKITVYAENADFALLNSASMRRNTSNVVHKLPPTMNSGHAVAEHGSILSACVIAGTIVVTHKTGLKTTLLECVVPAVWERAIRIVHKFRTGSPESQREILAHCRLPQLPSPNRMIYPANVELPPSSTSCADVLDYMYEHTTQRTALQSQSLIDQWALVSANSRIVAIIASEVLKSLVVPFAAPNPVPELPKLLEQLEDTEKDVAKYGSRGAVHVVDSLTTEAAALRSKIDDLNNAMGARETSAWNHIKALMMQLNEWSDQLFYMRDELWCDEVKTKAKPDLGCDTMDSKTIRPFLVEVRSLARNALASYHFIVCFTTAFTLQNFAIMDCLSRIVDPKNCKRSS